MAPSRQSAQVVAAVKEFAEGINREGLGENKNHHGITLIIADKNQLEANDADGHPKFILFDEEVNFFEGKNYNVLTLTKNQKRAICDSALNVSKMMIARGFSSTFKMWTVCLLLHRASVCLQLSAC